MRRFPLVAHSVAAPSVIPLAFGRATHWASLHSISEVPSLNVGAVERAVFDALNHPARCLKRRLWAEVGTELRLLLAKRVYVAVESTLTLLSKISAGKTR